MIEFSVDNMLKGGVDSVMVVLGYRSEEVKSVLFCDHTRVGRIQYSVNEDYASTQMLDSIKVGLSQMKPCDAFFLTPGDMPAIDQATYKLVSAEYQRDRSLILFPTLDGYRKHPPLVDYSLKDEILAFEGEGLRSFWDEHASDITEIPVNDPGVWMDADYPEDIAKIREYLNAI